MNRYGHFKTRVSCELARGAKVGWTGKIGRIGNSTGDRRVPGPIRKVRETVFGNLYGCQLPFQLVK